MHRVARDELMTSRPVRDGTRIAQLQDELVYLQMTSGKDIEQIRMETIQGKKVPRDFDDSDMWSISTSIFEDENDDEKDETGNVQVDNPASMRDATTSVQGNHEADFRADQTLYSSMDSRRHNHNKHQSPQSHVPGTYMIQLILQSKIPAWRKADSALLALAMLRSRHSQEVLQNWDKQRGLPRSHSSTMMNTSRSRRQIQEGKILSKWHGKPLVESGASKPSSKRLRCAGRGHGRRRGRRIETLCQAYRNTSAGTRNTTTLDQRNLL